MSLVMWLVILAVACFITAFYLDSNPYPGRNDKDRISHVCMDCGQHYGGPKPKRAMWISHGLCRHCERCRTEELFSHEEVKR